MQADDIPTSITNLIYSAPFKNQLSQNDVAALVAHFWPAIEQHIREQVATEIEQQTRTWEGMSGQATERARGMTAAASIARGTAAAAGAGQ
ncbi:hypothetical protein [Streptacidiphilus sp. EB129]|uniref:hypothetical protein n=1 Tax=Streptacidiphilus sp. EB129 TaxID=3156262 RepID=UPI00351318FD